MSAKHSSSYLSYKNGIADITLWEKLDTIPARFAAASQAIIALVSSPFRDIEKTPKTLFRHVVLTGIRGLMTRTSVKQQQYLADPTDDAYAVWCKGRGVEPLSEMLEDGTAAHWVGSPKADKLIINFHGGGYVLPATPFHFEFQHQIVAQLKAKGDNAACLFLSYDLAPQAIYPRQLQQAAMMLNHVLNDLNFKPENIILMGDSAGGNLCTQLLSHIHHPHASSALPIPKVNLSGSLRGAVLVSPWVDFDTTEPSFIHNEFKDSVAEHYGKRWSAAFMACPWPHTSASDNYNQAITAPSSWWEGLPVDSVLLIAGAEEVLVDGILKFSKKLTEGMGKEKVELLVAQGEYHDQPVTDVQLGFKEESEGLGAKKIKSWIASRL